MKPFQTVCSIEEIPEGEARMFIVDDQPVGIFHVAGEFHALANDCPHAGASLAHGLIEGDVVRCRIHHWAFCIRTGNYLDEARPQFDAKTFAIRVVNDEVQVQLN